jgi:NADH-quinone oxidoreductase subunit E
MMLNDTLRSAIAGYFSRYPTKQAALLPALHTVQEKLGFVPPEAVEEIADLLELQPAEVQDALTFYGFFKQNRPLGKYRVWICRSITCDARGSEALLQRLQEKLGIQPGETTPDGRITLETAECLGACDYSPAVLVNDVMYEDMNRTKIDALIESLK